ncbi:nucleosome assembly protein 1-like 1 isoform X2 [Drosophila grimshawi]|uniref:nucleosome assembly protein 1-like 1 isoform X2 n=1 Tax=Drosophila grimshawi TaxID=7222 RepID=UPI000C870D15|nr:nucleosome assembly protein 1-like 1 isoform X2 [Drosophila grimshawi]
MEELCRATNKLKISAPQPLIDTSKIKFSENDMKVISDLKQLYMQTINLDVKMQHEIYNMEKSYEKQHNEIFDKRKKILEDFKKQNHGDATSIENVSKFWLIVLKASYTEFITKDDEKILLHMIDLRSKHYNDDTVQFVLEFTFEKNDYFKNRILTKTYILNCTPNKDDPISFDGAEIVKCEGCQIDWKHPAEREKLVEPSFFDFFSPPILPEDPEDLNFKDINAILQNDFELGFYLKERVIPKAVVFFTGEIADCQSSDTESETDGSDDDDDDESNGGEEASSNNECEG